MSHENSKPEIRVREVVRWHYKEPYRISVAGRILSLHGSKSVLLDRLRSAKLYLEKAEKEVEKFPHDQVTVEMSLDEILP